MGSASDLWQYCSDQGYVRLAQERYNTAKQVMTCTLDNQEICRYHINSSQLMKKYNTAIWAHLTLNHQEILVMAILGDKQCQ